MEAALRQDYQENRYYSLDESADKLVKRIGKHCGLNDIREAHLIDPDWMALPMRPWSEVYDEMCCEVGHAYGLNDIREA